MHKPIIIGLVGLITIIYSITQICLYRDLAHKIHSLEQELGKHHLGEFDYKDGESKFAFYPNIFQHNDKNEFMTLLKNKLDCHWDYFKQKCLDTGNIIMVYDKEIGNCKPQFTEEPFKNSNLSKLLPDMRQIYLSYSMMIIGGVSIISYAIIISIFYFKRMEYNELCRFLNEDHGRIQSNDQYYIKDRKLRGPTFHINGWCGEWITNYIRTNNPLISRYTANMLLETLEALRQHINEFKPWWEKDIVRFNPN